MRKTDLISVLAERLEMTKADSTEVVNAVFDIMKEALVNEGVVDIHGFIKIYLAEKPEQTRKYSLGEKKGEEYVVPAHTVPRAKFAKSVKEAVYNV